MTNRHRRTSESAPSKLDELDALDMFQVGDDQTLNEIEQELENASSTLDAMPQASRARPTVRRRSQPQQQRSTRAGSQRSKSSACAYVVLVFGLVMAGLELVAHPALTPVMGGLANLGLRSGVVVLAGILLLTLNQLRTRQTTIQESVDTMNATLLDNESQVNANLDYLVSAQEHHLDRPPASGEELEQVLLALQRQDDKINNLTKALKMYGKPLIEITKMLSEITGRQEAVATSLQGSHELILDIQKLTTGANEAVRMLPEQMQKVQPATESSGVDDLHAMLRTMQREIAGVATGLAQLKNSATSGSYRAAVDATADREINGRTTTPDKVATPADGTKPSATTGAGADGLAQSIAGTKSTSGKGVMGSIQKLRKMRK